MRYCFVDFYGMESKWQVELMTPLSARNYLEAYYDLDKAEDLGDNLGLRSLVQSFEGRSLITCAALKETWPDGEWQEDGSDDEAEIMQPNPAGNPASSNTDLSLGPKAPAPNAPSHKSLRDHSLDTVLDKLLDQSQDVAALMAEAEVLTDFIPKLRLRLYNQAADLEPSTSLLHLLHKALEHDVEVDLAPFTTLTVEHLSVLFAWLRKGPMRVLNLSNMNNLTESDLTLILGDNPSPGKQTGSTSPLLTPEAGNTGNLKAVILLETPNVSIDFLTEHLAHFEVYHSGLFRRPMQIEYGYDKPSTPALNFAAPNSVTQLVWIGLSSMQSCDGKLRLENGCMDWSSLRYNTEAASTFSRDTKNIKYKNFLMDVPLPVGKMLHGLQRLLQYMTSPNLSWFADWPKGAARCFATTSPYDDESEYSVGPLSTTFYRDDDREDFVESGKGRLLKAGQWAIVLVQEAFDAKSQEALDKRELEIANSFGPRGTEGLKEWPDEEEKPTFKPLKRLRYVLARALPESKSSEKQYLVTDALGYVRDVMEEEGEKGVEAKFLSNWWERETSKFRDGLGYYEDDDIHDILRRVYSSQVSDEGADYRPRGVDAFEDIMRMMTMAKVDERGEA